MNYILFGDQIRNELKPITFTRPIADILFGITTIREKWEWYLQCKTSTLTDEYLNEKYPLVKENENILINSSICPDDILIDEIKKLKPNQVLVQNELIIAFYLKAEDLDGLDLENTENVENIETKSNLLRIANLWDIFVKNDIAIRNDFERLTKNRKSQPISNTNRVIGNQVFIEEGAKVECAILNSTTGPIYIGKDAEIMEGVTIRGPFALGEHAVVKMNAKIYGATTIGNYSKVGGEINNSVVFAYSNKAHDGFLGNSVIGEWCNLGADTNNSNLKNNYENVKLWNYAQHTFIDTELQFCGLIMGDHSKCGINTMFNTGTVVGVSANIFGAGFQRNFIPSFSWGGTGGFITYELNKAIETARKVYQRREIEFSKLDEKIMKHVFELTFENRKMNK